MTVRTPDIRFTCRHCGQRIAVDASAAGVETACPACNGQVVIPQSGALVDREAITASVGRGNGSARDAAMRGERLQRDLAVARKECGQLQEQLRELGDERAQLQTGIGEATKRLHQANEDLEVARERIKALEVEAAAMQTRRTAAEKELAEAKAEIVRLQDESSMHRRDFDAARAKLVTADAGAQRAAALETELHAAEEKLTAAIVDGKRLEQRCEELRVEAETARRELVKTESGRELTALRGRFKKIEAESKQLAAQLSDAQSEVRRLATGEREWRGQFDTMRKERDAALRRADAGSDAALQHGNDVLRGILDRQKGELDERYTELRRLRGAQLSLRILYAIGVVLFLAAVVFGLLALHGMWR